MNFPIGFQAPALLWGLQLAFLSPALALILVNLYGAHLRHSGARPSDIINTRAIVSVAWVAGPPLATFIIGLCQQRCV